MGRWWERRENDTQGWAELFRKFPFFSAYKYYIQVEVSASSEDLFNQWYGFVESRMRRFIPFIEAREGVRTHLYPKSFAPVAESTGTDV